VAVEDIEREKDKTMSMVNIGADAAKLAGLQIDTLQKVRSGQITLGQWERFNNLSMDDREVRFGDWKKPEAPVFTLLIDLGIITVPENYEHANRLMTFGKQNSHKFYHYDENITDKNFPNPTRILKFGDKFYVRAFKPVSDQRTPTSEECMAFLVTQKAIYTGVQGMSLVFEQKCNRLLKGKWYISFDEKERLWTDTCGKYKLPYMNIRSGDVFQFHLADFENLWGVNSGFLCFQEVSTT